MSQYEEDFADLAEEIIDIRYDDYEWDRKNLRLSLDDKVCNLINTMKGMVGAPLEEVRSKIYLQLSTMDDISSDGLDLLMSDYDSAKSDLRVRVFNTKIQDTETIDAVGWEMPFGLSFGLALSMNDGEMSIPVVRYYFDKWDKNLDDVMTETLAQTLESFDVDYNVYTRDNVEVWAAVSDSLFTSSHVYILDEILPDSEYGHVVSFPIAQQMMICPLGNDRDVFSRNIAGMISLTKRFYNAGVNQISRHGVWVSPDKEFLPCYEIDSDDDVNFVMDMP